MFHLPDRYKTDVKVALKDFIPKELKLNDKKRIKDTVKEVRLVYQIAGEEIPSVVDSNYRCQVIQFFDIEVADIKDAQFLASTYQNLIKPYCVIHIHDANIIERTQRPMGIIDEYSSTQAAKMLESMGLGKYFNYSKPYELIKYLISRIDCENEIILDFFSGSGTTAHSVICSNEEDRKGRKFILIQFPELLDENTDAYQEGYRTICDLGKERIRNVEERMSISSACDTGFKVFRVADCQTAHCGRRKPHFDFGGNSSPIVPYRNLPQTFRGLTADCRSLV